MRVFRGHLCSLTDAYPAVRTGVDRSKQELPCAAWSATQGLYGGSRLSSIRGCLFSLVILCVRIFRAAVMIRTYRVCWGPLQTRKVYNSKLRALYIRPSPANDLLRPGALLRLVPINTKFRHKVSVVGPTNTTFCGMSGAKATSAADLDLVEAGRSCNGRGP